MQATCHSKSLVSQVKKIIAARPIVKLKFGFIALMLAAGVPFNNAAFAVQPSSARSGSQPASIEIVQRKLTLAVGEKTQLKAVVRNSAGKVLKDAQVVFFSGSWNSLGVTPSGSVEAYRPGQHKVVALSPKEPFEGEPDYYTAQGPGVRAEITFSVPQPPLASLEFVDEPSILYVGAPVTLRLQAIDESGALRRDVQPVLRVSDSAVASTDGVGEVTGLQAGRVTVRAVADKVTATLQLAVRDNPIHTVELTATQDQARTGDVIHFQATGKDRAGKAVRDVPVSFALQSLPDANRAESVGAGAPAQITPDGRFVAEQPGTYTIVAWSGSTMARRNIQITPRDVGQRLELVGHAPVRDRVTSDLWVWEGEDGRDYAVHGTWNADGHTYFYDVTDPSSMQLVNIVQVDARTINDVKVSEDGRICVISREGASNRRNGIVILDVSDPRNVRIISEFDDNLTGGVHNVFIHDNHVYAVNNLRLWDIINIEDPRNPVRVGRFETETPGRVVHDVWVRDGIAYQAGGTDGLIMVDVGGGGMGGSPARPVEMGRMPQLTGWNHSAWPFKSKSSGNFYVVGGDEMFWDNPLAPGVLISWKEKVPSYATGWLHFVDFNDPAQPREVARYQVPESGPHNLWIDWENELMYVGHFEAGLRVVDISGELMGDLYRQGREIAKFYSDDGQGFIPNAPFVWGPQPYKGHIFFTDLYSGLWAVKLVSPGDGKKVAGN